MVEISNYVMEIENQLITGAPPCDLWAMVRLHRNIMEYYENTTDFFRGM